MRQAHFSTPLAPLSPPLKVYHLGHSLVGRDMPAMLAQMGGHDWHGQLGWGTSLRDHWRGEIAGAAAENDHPAFRSAREALASGGYQVLVLTEMVALEDALRHHDSVAALADWVRLARRAAPEMRAYLYETWHHREAPEAWLAKLDRDLPALWEGRLLYPAMARLGGAPIHVVPGGQVMAAFARAARAGEMPQVASEAALFFDNIHFSDLGAYLMALTHYAVIYGRSPEGLPAALRRADGSPADAPSPSLALAMQRLVWRVVQNYPPSGVPKAEAVI